MKLTFLGTGGSTPTKFRGLPSLAIDHGGDLFLFDCGEGTQRQMLQFSVNMAKLKAVFLSHTHGDHILGIAGLVRTLALNRRTEQLEIYVPQGGESIIQTLIGFDKAVLNYRIIIKPIKSGQIYRGRDFSITAFKLQHNTSTFGFIFKENDRLRFLKPKIKNLGIKGKAFGTLIKNKSMKINGKTIRLKDLTVMKLGRKVVYATDTRPTNETLKAAKDADVFIHESTYAETEKLLAKQRFHSTALEGATIARKAKAKRLVLTHTSARYRDEKVLVREANKVFKNAEVAKDGLVIEL